MISQGSQSATLHRIRPTLMIDKKRVLGNIQELAAKARKSGVIFRPHFKTHHSQEIGRWFRESGVDRITVSSVMMAEYFAADGWSDLTIAMPVNLREIPELSRLAATTRLGVLVDSERAVERLAAELTHPVQVWIKIDVGYHRAGILWDQSNQIITLAEKILNSTKLTLAGILTHNGHSYQANSETEIRNIYQESTARLNAVQSILTGLTSSPLLISTGDTPCCSVVDDFRDVDEIRPGNFVFYDLMQLKLGTCRPDRIAIAVACPVIGKYQERQQLVIYGGAVHFSKEYLRDNSGRKVFGYLAHPAEEGLGSINFEAPLRSLSQEHGIVNVPSDLWPQIEIGDSVLVVPVHSCLTCDLHDEFVVV